MLRIYNTPNQPLKIDIPNCVTLLKIIYIYMHVYVFVYITATIVYIYLFWTRYSLNKSEIIT